MNMKIGPQPLTNLSSLGDTLNFSGMISHSRPIHSSQFLLGAAVPSLSPALQFTYNIGVGFFGEVGTALKELSTPTGLLMGLGTGVLFSYLPILSGVGFLAGSLYGAYSLYAGVSGLYAGKLSAEMAGQKIGQGLFYGALTLNTVRQFRTASRYSRLMRESMERGISQEGKVLTKPEEFRSLVKGIREEVVSLVKTEPPEVSKRILHTYDNPTMATDGIGTAHVNDHRPQINLAPQAFPDNLTGLEKEVMEVSKALTKFHEAVHVKQAYRNPRLIHYCEAQGIEGKPLELISRFFRLKDRPPLFPTLRGFVSRIRAHELEAHELSAEVAHKRLGGIDWRETTRGILQEKSHIVDNKELGGKLHPETEAHLTDLFDMLGMNPKENAKAVVYANHTIYPTFTFLGRSATQYAATFYLYSLERRAYKNQLS